nr:MAG TPA: hypothetical protein [Caudoviricetes sp.]
MKLYRASRFVTFGAARQELPAARQKIETCLGLV